MLRAAFVRTLGERDHIYVTRSDGSETSWSFPTYGDGLPKGGADKYAAYGDDQGELQLAEALANAPWSAEPDQIVESVREACRETGLLLPTSLSRERVEQTQATLTGLARRWRELLPKGAFDLTFERAPPHAAEPLG